MYKCRLNKLKPTLEAFINNFKHIYEVDKHVHLMEMIYEMFIRKWTPYNYLVTLMYWINLSVQVWTWLAYLVFCLKSCMHIQTQMFISCVSMPWWQNIICNTALPNKNLFKIFLYMKLFRGNHVMNLPCYDWFIQCHRVHRMTFVLKQSAFKVSNVVFIFSRPSGSSCYFSYTFQKQLHDFDTSE